MLNHQRGVGRWRVMLVPYKATILKEYTQNPHIFHGDFGAPTQLANRRWCARWVTPGTKSISTGRPFGWNLQHAPAQPRQLLPMGNPDTGQRSADTNRGSMSALAITRSPRRSRYPRGNVNENTEPRPRWLVTSTCPPCASIMAFTIASPIPVPCTRNRCPCPR